MPFIKSISGFRGTIGGSVGDNLTPIDIVECSAAYGEWLKTKHDGKLKVILGRDGRISGPMVGALVTQTLIALGIDVLDLGLSTTPTVEVAVPLENAHGGIILTASHNPKEYNALKLLNDKGEFISAADGANLLSIADRRDFNFAAVDDLGQYATDDSYIQKHIDAVNALPYVDLALIQSKSFKVVVDCVNSTGAISIVPQLEQLGCEVIALNAEITGDFAHNPEPLPKHLGQLSDAVKSHNADIGVAVDPDVDRLVFIGEKGEPFGEEYTIVAIADIILQVNPGNTVSNLSSSRALRDVTEKHGCKYTASKVGEVNVVETMKSTNAVFGGEGNGGVILPELHYGRDSLVGVAIVLSYLAKTELTVSKLRSTYTDYFMQKDKFDLSPGLDVDDLLVQLAQVYHKERVDTRDGVKIDLDDGWIHIRKSNTEPIVRIYTEAITEQLALNLVNHAKDRIADILKAS